MHLGKHYNMDEYDFKQYIVSRCLPDVNCEQDDQKYICLLSSDKTLHITDNENPVVLYHIKDKCLIAAAKFMKLLLEKPEYVCTCCHANKEFICKPCHRTLKEENFKQQCVNVVEKHEVKTCFFCGNIP